MPLPQNPLINGKGGYPDFTSIRVAAGPLRDFVGFTELNYSDNCEPGEARGAQQQILAFTPGEYKAEGSLSVHKRYAQEFRRLLGNGFMLQSFNLIASYDMNDGLGLITDEVLGCRLKKQDNAHKQGSDPLMEKWDLAVHIIKWNGILPIPRARL